LLLKSLIALCYEAMPPLKRFFWEIRHANTVAMQLYARRLVCDCGLARDRSNRQDDTLSDTKSTFILGLYNQTKVDKKVTIIELEKLWKGKLQESPFKAIYRLWSEKKIPGNPTLYADQDKTKEQVIRAALQQIWDNSGRQWPRAVTAVTGWLADQVKHSRDNKLTELLNRWGVAALTQQWAKDFD
jgi:hypothetical protein